MTENVNPGTPMHLQASDLAAFRGEELIFEGVSFSLTSGEALVLTGKNGSGKSTLLRVLAGLLRQETGAITVTNAVIRIQNPDGTPKKFPRDTFLPAAAGAGTAKAA